MSIQTVVPQDSLLMMAWKVYESSEDFQNTRRWALREEHVNGSLWAAFLNGWLAAGGTSLFAPPPGDGGQKGGE